MLEALVSWRHNGETALKRSGDILIMALTGHPWGKMDKKFHSIVEFDDPELEAKLREKTSPNPVISLPYCEFNPSVGDEEPVMKVRSTFRANKDNFSAKILDPTVEVNEISRTKTDKSLSKSIMLKDAVVIGELGRSR
jgi:hypothetical protein